MKITQMQEGAGMQGLGMARRVSMLWVIGALFLGFLVYWPGLSGGFVLDDFANLVENQALEAGALHAHFWSAVWSSGSSQLHRPLSMLSFATEIWFTGMDPWSLKLVNVLIHLFNGLLIFFLSRQVLEWLNRRDSERGADWLVSSLLLSILITAAWILAPIQLTAVLYVIQRMEALAAMFVLLGLLVYWRGRMLLIEGEGHAWWWIWGGLGAGTCLATLSKETGVLLPVYAFLIEWLVLRFRGRGQVFEGKLIWMYGIVLFLPALLGLAWLLPGILSGVAYHTRSFDLPQRLWTEGRVMIDYLHWIVAPTPNALSLYHDDIVVSTGWFQPWTTVASWMLIAGFLVSAWLLRFRAPVYALGVLWFFAGQALVSTVLPLELVYEHRNYLPSWGVFLALFGLLSAWTPSEQERRRLIRLFVTVSGVALIALYAGFTTIRANIWGNPFRLAYFEATTHPASPRANYDLGRFLLATSSGADSPGYRMGEQIMLKTANLPNAGLQPLQALIFMAAKNRQPIDPSWWSSLRRNIQSMPVSAEDLGALYSLVHCSIAKVCHYSQADIRELQHSFNVAMARYPQRADIVTLAANLAANVTHDYDRAYHLMLRAVVLAPDKFQYWNNLMTMQMAAGRLDDAGHVLERLKELNALGSKDAEIAAQARKLVEKKAALGRMPEGGAS